MLYSRIERKINNIKNKLIKYFDMTKVLIIIVFKIKIKSINIFLKN